MPSLQNVVNSPTEYTANPLSTSLLWLGFVSGICYTCEEEMKMIGGGDRAIICKLRQGINHKK
jgi:hypothetical protein